MAKGSRKKKQRAHSGVIIKPAPYSGGRMIVLLKALCIAAVTFWIYAPAIHGQWFDDDKLYLSENPLRNDPHHLWKTWLAPGSFIEYYPITETVQMLQWRLWGMDSVGYVVTNAALHVISALLIWLLLKKLGLRLAWLGGLLFAIHPMNVESVAWISELKNALSLPPFLLAMWAWIRFEEKEKTGDYWLALGLYLTAMLCKVTVSPFPILILLYAWWKRGRIDFRTVWRSVPFFAISLVLGMTTSLAGKWFGAQRSSAAVEVPVGGMLSRAALSGVSGLFYLGRFFWPWAPSPMYPQWKVDPPSLWQFLPWLILAAALCLCWIKRSGWGRHVLLGLSFFYLFLAPFLGFYNISYMRYTWVMDHFLYVPMIGLIGLVVAGLDKLFVRMPVTYGRWGAGAAAFGLLFLLARASHAYAGIFSNQEALYTYTVRLYPDAAAARYNLGRVLLEKGDTAGAISQLEQAVTMHPSNAEARFILGTALMQDNRLPDAAAQFQQTIHLEPRYADAYDNLGAALLMMGRPDKAMTCFRQAIAICDYSQPHNDMGNALTGLGRIEEAIAEYRKAVKLDPDVVQLHDNLAGALAREKQIPEAKEEYEEAAKLDPQDSTARAALEEMGSAPR